MWHGGALGKDLVQPGTFFMLLPPPLASATRAGEQSTSTCASWPVFEAVGMPGASTQLLRLLACRPCPVRNNAPYNVLTNNHICTTENSKPHGQAHVGKHEPAPGHRKTGLHKGWVQRERKNHTHTHTHPVVREQNRCRIQKSQCSIAKWWHRLGRSTDIGLHPPLLNGRQAGVLRGEPTEGATLRCR